jgi:imidazole glycerol-phosphate synthase subunit HisH
LPWHAAYGMLIQKKVDENGLGWFDAEVIRFRVKNTIQYKVPHMGWNKVTKEKQSEILDDD